MNTNQRTGKLTLLGKLFCVPSVSFHQFSLPTENYTAYFLCICVHACVLVCINACIYVFFSIKESRELHKMLRTTFILVGQKRQGWNHGYIHKCTEIKREKSFNISIFLADGRKYLDMMTLPRCASICCGIAHTEKPCSLKISQELSQTKHIN